jgi:hypothetical protein
MYLQTVTRITQLGLGQPVVYWAEPDPHSLGRNPLCLVVSGLSDDSTMASWTTRTAHLAMRPGGYTAEVRQENLVSPHQVPWHQTMRTVDAGLIELRHQLWRRVWLPACSWCPQAVQSVARYLTELGDPVCVAHATTVMPEGAELREWSTDAVARVYAALDLA